MTRYSATDYWDRVGRSLRAREDDASLIAGDDTRFYRAKRRLFLEHFLGPAVEPSASVLEVGSGPGGNLAWLAPRAAVVVGADISGPMLEVARRNGAESLVKVDGVHLPFRDRAFSVVFTATVLQHSPPDRCIALLREMTRVCRDGLHLFEDTAPVGIRDRRSHWLRRPGWYAARMEALGFGVASCERLPLTWQELAAVAARVTAGRHQDGDPLSPARVRLERQLLRVARIPDRVLPPIAGLTRMSFRRER